MKSLYSSNQNYHQLITSRNQSGFTLIELMIVIAIIGLLASVAIGYYQYQMRKAYLATIYQETNHFRLPYHLLMEEGARAVSYRPNILGMPTQTKYCQFSVTAPNSNAVTLSAVVCRIQNLDYLSNQTITLDLNADGFWQCKASAGIPKLYLPKDCR
jgi:type IV pilus assembly protein PilA